MSLFKSYSFSGILMILLLYFSAFVAKFDEFNVFALYFAIPLSAIICRLYYKTKVTSKWLGLLIILFIWIMFTGLFADYPSIVQRHLTQILGVFLLCYIVNTLSKRNSFIPVLYVMYIVYFIGMFYFIYSRGLLTNFDYTVSRLAEGEGASVSINANEPAYFTFFSTVSIFMLGEIINNRSINRILKLLFFSTIPISFGVALLTGARQTLIIQIPTILLLLYCRYPLHSKKSQLLIIIIIGLAGYILPKALDVYDNSTLSHRAEKNVNDDVRTRLIKDACRVGMENPIVGVGPGCYIKYSREGGFSHCTYTELFANSGIPALLIYSMMLLSFVRLQYVRYKRTKDTLFKIFLIVGLMYVIYNFFYVFYQSLWLMAFFFLIANHSDTYYRNKYLIQ